MEFSGKIRFAPSPTGYLHEGHLLSALYVWAAAKKWNLHIHLRIEDHDRGRTRQAYIDGIREDLNWLGLHYHSESIQSQRQDLYQNIFRQLKEKGLVYPCYCSRKQLESENPRSDCGEIIYQGKCKNDDSHREADPHNFRFRISDKTIKWTDRRLGDFIENPSLQCGDFPIQDRDGFFTYQFCVCVDDIEQGMTHIIRGEDIRNSTARQIDLSKRICEVAGGLGNIPPEYRCPFYLHHALIVDSLGKKLSKRELAHSIRQDKGEGISPNELFGRVLFKAKLLPTPSSISLQDAIDTIARIL